MIKINQNMNENKIDKPQGILIFGANGSGKTTLGKELSRVLNFWHMDHETYAFRESKIPYTDQRSHDECIELMLSDINKHRKFVLSAVTGDFGEIINQYYIFAIYISAPLELRIKRFDQREYEKYKERVLPGGDLYDSRIKFRDFIASRSLSKIDEWANTLVCPIININGCTDIKTNICKIIQFYKKEI